MLNTHFGDLALDESEFKAILESISDVWYTGRHISQVNEIC